ncbi:uncharacterized protein N7503_007756 [Penicillium pulvis]|uniref:uncharacterized protein n=1 Tax=Penicillium pulvis TaxID=1562058 RepID=UPI00254802D0|nr:uncharacterized protein N7503_007756 [Penicillium pulvis]KAJ5798460.1 hypothetical protein N7503_007756 [Penicillium pulvis]
MKRFAFDSPIFYDGLSDRIIQYYSSDMPPSGIPEGNSDPSRYEADVPTTLRQQQPIWQSVDPILFSSSPKIVNPPPDSGLRIPHFASQYNSTPFSVMHRAVPIQQEQTIRQRETPHQPKEQGNSFGLQTTSPPQIPTYDHAMFLACGEHEESHQPNNSPSEILKCHWKGCRYTGTFGRKAELKRHVETQHIFPKAYKCPKCGRPCNRDDNLNGHLRRVHKSDVQVTQM